MTHVCRSWREIFLSRSSLWAFLDCSNIHKTLAHIKRSKSFPLDIRLKKLNDRSYRDDALLLVVPHTNRLGSLTVCGSANVIPDLVRRFHRPAPHLRKLKINLTHDRNHAPAFPTKLFDGDLSSLRELNLAGFATNLPWRNLINLSTLRLSRILGTTDLPFMIYLLDFLGSAPLLSSIELSSVPAVLDTLPARIVPIPHLKRLVLYSPSAHSTLLKYISVPTGASLVLDFPFSGGGSPIFDCLPRNFINLRNLSRITSISLLLGPGVKYTRFDGPSGRLYLYGTWTDRDHSSHTTQCQIFRSIGELNMASTQRLAVTRYTPSPGNMIDKSPVFQALLPMNDLRTLTLLECNNRSFIRALNPEKNRPGTVACPNLENLVLYIEELDQLCILELKEMASARAGRYARLPSITIVGLGELLPKGEVFTLREHFPHVEYKVDVELPEWDTLSGDEGAKSGVLARGRTDRGLVAY